MTRIARAMLTGATQGIGRAAARDLCPLVDVLVLHVLEPEGEVQRFLDELRRQSAKTEVVYLSADYGRLGDIGTLAAAVRERVDGLELLINNAGRPGPASRTLSVDGHEITFQTNYQRAGSPVRSTRSARRPSACIPESSRPTSCTRCSAPGATPSSGARGTC